MSSQNHSKPNKTQGIQLAHPPPQTRIIELENKKENGCGEPRRSLPFSRKKTANPFALKNMHNQKYNPNRIKDIHINAPPRTRPKSNRLNKMRNK
jgi:hypothetical protein